MATKRKSPPKKIKNTPSGKRALAAARGKTKDILKNPSGSRSSISTMTVGVEHKGKERTLIVPTVVKQGGKMVRLKPDAAVTRALKTKDFAMVKKQKTGDRRSKKFSKR
ncbi:unnamed protein product, partial [marine sediment metagenome]